TAITRRLIGHGLGSGLALGIIIALLAFFAGPVFTSDPGILAALPVTLLVMALGVPLAGFVFVLDGVLIGAGDARYLALSGLANLAVYVPLLVWVALSGPSFTGAADALAWLWVAFGFGYMGARALTLGLRARGTRWVVTGSTKAG